MPLPHRAYGRPGTAVIPRDWGASHAPVAAGTMVGAKASFRHDGNTDAWSDGAVTDPYLTDTAVRVQAQTQLANNSQQEAAEEMVVVAGYLVTVADETSDFRIGDLVDLAECDDALLEGKVLEVVQVVRGSIRFERDLFCTLTGVQA